MEDVSTQKPRASLGAISSSPEVQSVIETTPKSVQTPPQVEIPTIDPLESLRVLASTTNEKLVHVEEQVLPQVEREVVVLTTEEKRNLPLKR